MEFFVLSLVHERRRISVLLLYVDLVNCMVLEFTGHLYSRYTMIS